jgi:hypothetical protein
MSYKKAEIKKSLQRKLEEVSANRSKKDIKKVSYQFQEVSLKIIEQLDTKLVSKGMLFAFIKRKMKEGMWYKINEVSNYMEVNKIRSPRYFMKALSNRNVFKNKDE